MIDHVGMGSKLVPPCQKLYLRHWVEEPVGGIHGGWKAPLLTQPFLESVLSQLLLARKGEPVHHVVLFLDQRHQGIVTRQSWFRRMFSTAMAYHRCHGRKKAVVWISLKLLGGAPCVEINCFIWWYCGCPTVVTAL
mmetsp:Transcript_40659/g.79538  ORF Transcript_40659/g.79538 Transcript_40659/m.79538 type:complete len:136 (-) Transcript_40659:383-790(-)